MTSIWPDEPKGPHPSETAPLRTYVCVVGFGFSVVPGLMSSHIGHAELRHFGITASAGVQQAGALRALMCRQRDTFAG